MMASSLLLLGGVVEKQPRARVVSDGKKKQRRRFRVVIFLFANTLFNWLVGNTNIYIEINSFGRPKKAPIWVRFLVPARLDTE